MGSGIPPWPALEAFVAAARCGSFKEASDALGLSASAFTRRIQTLEHCLGLRLFDREAQRAVLTPAGRHYFDLIRPGFEDLRAATAAMRPDGNARPLRLRISHSLAAIWLAPRLARFCAAHPDIDLQLQATGTPEDLDGGLIDIGIFFAREPFVDLATCRLFAIDAFVVAAPGMLAAPVATVEDLARYPLLDLTDPGEIWPEWLHAVGYRSEAPRTRLLFDSIEVMYQAAAAGAGLALGLRPIVDSFLADRRLTVVLKQSHAIPGAYYAAASRRTLRHTAAGKLWRWIGQESAAGPVPIEPRAGGPAK